MGESHARRVIKDKTDAGMIIGGLLSFIGINYWLGQVNWYAELDRYVVGNLGDIGAMMILALSLSISVPPGVAIGWLAGRAFGLYRVRKSLVSKPARR